MAPNLIGNSFMLAEATVQSDHDVRPNQSVITHHRPSSSTTSPSIDGPKKITKQSLDQLPKNDEYKMEIVWRNVIAFAIIHLFALYGAYLTITNFLILEFCFAHVIGTLGGFGITIGAHRLWAHRAFKAKWQLRVLLMIFQTIAFQNSIYEWVRDHRVHHKFTDTNADPHNSKRGFFFCHMGWLMVKKHPDVKTKGKMIDMSDLEADPIVMFQKRHYITLMPLFCFVLPALLPYFYFGTPIEICFFGCSMYRWVLSLHYTWLVNSAAHMWGMKPYDKGITSTENKLVSILAYGEGWHNYHHVFPWDYKAAELGNYRYNLSTAVLDFFAKIGWAYDLKTVSEKMISQRINRTGDGSHKYSKEAKKTEELIMELNEKCNHDDEETHIWGWDDKDLSEEERKGASISYRESDSS